MGKTIIKLYQNGQPFDAYTIMEELYKKYPLKFYIYKCNEYGEGYMIDKVYDKNGDVYNFTIVFKTKDNRIIVNLNKKDFPRFVRDNWRRYEDDVIEILVSYIQDEFPNLGIEVK